jgi:hypothetical protein
MRHAVDNSASAAWEVRQRLRIHPGVHLWLDNFSYSEVSHDLLTGPSQVTDAWLAELARRDESLGRLFVEAPALFEESFDLVYHVERILTRGH